MKFLLFRYTSVNLYIHTHIFKNTFLSCVPVLLVFYIYTTYTHRTYFYIRKMKLNIWKCVSVCKMYNTRFNHPFCILLFFFENYSPSSHILYLYAYVPTLARKRENNRIYIRKRCFYAKYNCKTVCVIYSQKKTHRRRFLDVIFKWIVRIKIGHDLFLTIPSPNISNIM